MSWSLWLKLRWLFSNIFKRFLSFFTSDICLILCLMSYLKIMWWCHSCGKLTFLWSYTKDDMDYAMMSFSFWQRSTLKSSTLALCGPTAQCLAVRVTSLTIINLCSGGIVYGPSFIKMIIQVNFRVEKTLSFDSWHMCCTSLSLRR